MKNNPTSPALSNFQNSVKSLHTMLMARFHLTNAIHAASANVVHAAMAAAASVTPTSGTITITPGGTTPRLPVTASDSPTESPQPATTSPTTPISGSSVTNPDPVAVMVADWLNGAGEMDLNGMHAGVCEKNYNDAVRAILAQAVALQKAEHNNVDITDQLKSIMNNMVACSDEYAICCHAPIPFLQTPKL